MRLTTVPIPRVLAGAAACWLPAATSMAQWAAVPLHPKGAESSRVNAVTTTRQYGAIGTASAVYPSAWSGTALSAANLSHSPSLGGAVLGAAGAGLVGGLGNHAALWRGAAESFVGLHPGPGFRASDVFAMAPG